MFLSSSFTSPYLSGRFHLDIETGSVTVAGSLLADAGHVFHCEVEAKDKGHQPRIARGMVYFLQSVCLTFIPFIMDFAVIIKVYFASYYPN